MPALGASYHNSIFLLPTYSPCFTRQEREEKTIKIWTEDSISSLQACFDCTDWQGFFDACGDNIDELTETVSSYVTFCIDSVIPSKQVVIFPNNKPWVTKVLKSAINKKKNIFFTGNPQEKKAVAKEVKAEIAKAKAKYKEKIENQYVNGDLRSAWQGIKSMASINQHAIDTKQPISINGVEDIDLSNTFNRFFSRFERSDFTQDVSRLRDSLVPYSDILISQEQVNVLFKKTGTRKACGPDAICGRTLHHCADQLSEVFTRLFQMCLDSCQLPMIWKSSTIIPIPKVKNPRELNQFRPVALTSLVVKNLEKILKEEVLSLVEGKLDPLQFAYQTSKGVEDAKLFILDKVYKHLEKPNAHVRLLFADFSSAFNKMQPHILIERLASYFNLPDQLLTLFLNFLTDRTHNGF